jgi:hypothetical protein
MGTNTKEWPADGKPMDFTDLTNALRGAINFAYSRKRKNIGKDVPWNGPGVGLAERASCPPPAHLLKAESLRYSEEEQGRDTLDEILGIAIRLGMEQGRRVFMQSYEYQSLVTTLRTIQAMAGNASHNIKKDTKAK